jgi:hypothetical protein
VTALLDGRSNKADTLPTLKVRRHCSAQTSHAHGEDHDALELGICLEQDLRVSRAKHSRFPSAQTAAISCVATIDELG